MTDLTSTVQSLLALTGYQVSVPLPLDLSPEAYATLFDAVRLVLGPGFGVEVRSVPRPELILWREQRGPQYDG